MILKKKMWKLLAALLVVVLLVAGCGKGNNNANDEGATNGENNAGTGKGTDEVVTLQFIRWSNGPELDAEEEDKVKRFNESHPNIQVDMTLLPWDETFRKIELSLASNQPVDIFYWDPMAYGYYKNGYFLNLQPYFDRDIKMSEYNEELFEPMKFDGENIYVAPENYQTLVLYYNKDLFDAAGLDYPDETWTWEDVQEAAEKLTIREGNQTVQYGFDATAFGVWWTWMSIIESQGGSLAEDIHEPDRITLNTPEAKNALQMLQDMIFKDKVSPDVATKDSMGLNFHTGKVAMYAGGDWDLGSLRTIEDFEWGMAPLPKWGDKRTTPYFIGGYVINSKSKYPDEAWEFVKWCMTENQKVLAEQHSWIPVHNPSREQAPLPEWAPDGYEEARYGWMEDAQIGDIYHLKWREAIDKYMTPMQDDIFINGGDVEQALVNAEAKINELLQSE